MKRNPAFRAGRPLSDEGQPVDRRIAVFRLAMIPVALLVVFGGGVLIDRYNSAWRAANVQAALTARGLGPAKIDRVWKRLYVCKHAYVWRTAAASGSACTDSFSSSVIIYGAGEQPRVKCWARSGAGGWRLDPCSAS